MEQHNTSIINFRENEDEIAQVIIDFQKVGFLITVPKLHVLAWQYDHTNKINTFANNKDKKDRCTWGKYFLKHYLYIRVHRAVNLSIALAMAANKPNIRHWFAEYTGLEDLNIESPDYTWSRDGTGVQTIPKEEKYISEVNKPCTAK